jgi:hypothetical protein
MRGGARIGRERQHHCDLVFTVFGGRATLRRRSKTEIAGERDRGALSDRTQKKSRVCPDRFVRIMHSQEARTMIVHNLGQHELIPCSAAT